jgi:hypothetical protein
LNKTQTSFNIYITENIIQAAEAMGEATAATCKHACVVTWMTEAVEEGEEERVEEVEVERKAEVEEVEEVDKWKIIKFLATLLIKKSIQL